MSNVTLFPKKGDHEMRFSHIRWWWISNSFYLFGFFDPLKSCVCPISHHHTHSLSGKEEEGIKIEHLSSALFLSRAPYSSFEERLLALLAHYYLRFCAALLLASSLLSSLLLLRHSYPRRHLQTTSQANPSKLLLAAMWAPLSHKIWWSF